MRTGVARVHLGVTLRDPPEHLPSPPILLTSCSLLAWGLASAPSAHTFLLLRLGRVQESEGKEVSWVLFSCLISKLAIRGAGLCLHREPPSTPLSRFFWGRGFK